MKGNLLRSIFLNALTPVSLNLYAKTIELDFFVFEPLSGLFEPEVQAAGDPAQRSKTVLKPDERLRAKEVFACSNNTEQKRAILITSISPSRPITQHFF